MTLYKWSQTASVDATADLTINWAEGQSPASVNDSARAMMAAIAKYRDDMTGAIVTTGTATAYAVSSYQVFQTLAQLSGQVIAFTPHATNGATVTLNVDGLGAKPLRSGAFDRLAGGRPSARYSLRGALQFERCSVLSPWVLHKSLFHPDRASIDFGGLLLPTARLCLPMDRQSRERSIRPCLPCSARPMDQVMARLPSTFQTFVGVLWRVSIPWAGRLPVA